VSVDVPGLWITEWNGPAKPNTYDWSKENAKSMFPNKITSFGIHADDAFLFICTFSNPAYDVDLVIHDNRSRATTYVVLLPEDVFNVIWQGRFA
jgi:hypothetical protein